LLKRKTIRIVAAKVKGHDRDVLECNYFAKSHVTFTSCSNLLWCIVPISRYRRGTGPASAPHFELVPCFFVVNERMFELFFRV